MFGISETNILERGERDVPPDHESPNAVTIEYNSTNPLVLRDGVDRVTVREESDDQHLVEYCGYLTGYLRTTDEGVRELGRSFFGGQEGVPRWLLRTSDDAEGLPEWMPEEYDPQRTFSCHRCNHKVQPTDIVVPDKDETELTHRYCQDCWDEIRHRWNRRQGPDEPALERARYLDEVAATESVADKRDELVELIQTDDPIAQMHALIALLDVIAVHPADAIDTLPLLTTRLESDAILVRSAALICLRDLADEYPRQVTPAAGKVVSLVDIDGDDGILEPALPYIAAVAEEKPEAVLDAVPKLAGLLGNYSPHEQDILLALTRIAERYPASVLPIVSDLVVYIGRKDNAHRVAALATLGNVAKEYPNAAESAIPRLTEPLDSENPYLRANAAGLLTEQADEYPAKLRSVIPRVIELLDDDDPNARYNATSILAKVSKAYPTDVEPAIPSLIDALDEEFEYSRSNACWALGRLQADAALADLNRLKRSDSSEEVRTVAEWAIDQIERSNGDS